MKKLVLLLLAASLLLSKCLLTPAQLKIADECYSYGNKFKLGNTLVGICGVESNFGVWKIPVHDQNDYGITGINVDNLLYELGLENNKYNRSMIASILVSDDTYALTKAVENLLFWIRHYDYDPTSSDTYKWALIVEHYNQGVNLTRGGFKYAHKITAAIKRWKQCKEE